MILWYTLLMDRSAAVYGKISAPLRTFVSTQASSSHKHEYICSCVRQSKLTIAQILVSTCVSGTHTHELVFRCVWKDQHTIICLGSFCCLFLTHTKIRSQQFETRSSNYCGSLRSFLPYEFTSVQLDAFQKAKRLTATRFTTGIRLFRKA